MIKHLRQYFPINLLGQIYKIHVRLHLDYCDFIYHIPKLEKQKGDSDEDDANLDASEDDNDAADADADEEDYVNG